MAQHDNSQAEKDCLIAFQTGKRAIAEKLLPQLPQPATITTTISKQETYSRTPDRLKGALESPVSLLHLAAYWGWKTAVITLVSEYKCDANSEDERKHIPLHYAAYNGHLEVVKYFIEELHCDSMNIGNDFGDTALHYACGNGHLNVTRYLIKEEHCAPSCTNMFGNTPLHFASQNGQFEIVKHLIDVQKCTPSCENAESSTPLHFASQNGHLNIIKYLISKGCNPSCKNEDLWTPLHFACGTNGTSQYKIAKYLISKHHCDPLCKNKKQYTPFHEACRNGHYDIARYMISETNCDPSHRDKEGNSPLHFASMNGHLRIVRYLIEEKQCSPSCVDNHGWTPLHYACSNSKAKVVQYLLSTGRVNPLVENDNGETALYHASGKYDILRLFHPFGECMTAFPVHTFTKLILTGDSEAGKTTIAEVIVRLASHTAVESDVTDVKLYTAGIIPHQIQSEQFGNYVIYDFAGQQEYYSSHDAVLEQVMRSSAAIFVCVVDLSKTDEKICESLHYWLSFIDNACKTTEKKSHVLIVGSHADQVTSVEEKSSMLHEIATRRVRQQQYAECIAMDCRKTNTDALHRLITTLTKSQKAITSSQPVIHYCSHVVYAFLRTMLNVVGCTLHYLVSAIDNKNDSSLPKDQSVLEEILTTLSDKGLILFLQHHQSSWIIVNTETLLREINGTLFAPDHFKEYRYLASNTGIVPVSNLQKVFPNYDSKMVVGFLTSLQFCRLLDPSVLQYTNLQSTTSHSTDNRYFFPGLVLSERPDNLIQQGKLKFGYCLRCLDPHEFLSSRFLHVLLLSVAYKFPLTSQAASSSVSGLQCTCEIWRNGIFWRNPDNIVTVIELIDKNRCVLVAMSCDDTSPVKHAELRSSVIGLVRHFQQQYCPHLNVCEFLISPDLIQRFPLDNLPDSDLFDIHTVTRSMLLHKKGVPSYKDGRGFLTIEALPFEPYYQLSSSSVCQLLNPNLANQPVSSPLLQEVRQLCRQTKMKPKVYKELREHLDKLSLFAGRSPLVS